MRMKKCTVGTFMSSRAVAIAMFCMYCSSMTTAAFSLSRKNTGVKSTLLSASFQPDGVSNDPFSRETDIPSFQIGRRGLFRQAATTLATLGTITGALPTLPAHAGSLLQFPVGPDTQPLKNKYHFMRAGTSELEAQGIYSTNPLFLTNRENAMDASGEKLVLKALEKIRTETDLFPTIAYHSLAANGMDTGDLIARELRLGREKLLPEFTYLDQRGVGLWDSADESLIKPAIWALDYLEAGKLGMGGRPPANDDGTPNETLGDQFIRLRQFLSLQESRTSGDIILVIFPDGTGPALLSAMIAGIPFKDVHALEFAPGEVRLNITPESVRALFETKKDDPEYLAILEDGKEKLELLRSRKTRMVGLKEQNEEKERLAIDREYNLKKQEEKQREQERLQVIAQEKQLARERKEKAEQEKQAQKKAVKEEKERLRMESTSAISAGQSLDGANLSDGMGSSAILAATGVGVLGLGAIVLGAMGSSGDEERAKTTTNENRDRTLQTSSPPAPTVIPVAPITAAGSVPGPKTTVLVDKPLQDAPSPIAAASNEPKSLFQNPVPTVSSTTVPGTSQQRAEPTVNSVDDEMTKGDLQLDDSMIKSQLDQLAAAERAMKDALTEANEVKKAKSGSVDDYWDDDGDGWLNVLMEIRDEPDPTDEEDDGLIDMMLNGDRQSGELIDMVVNGDRRPDSGTKYTPKSADL